MTNTIAIIGAGPGLGSAVARRFGREGFSVALIARTAEKVGQLAEQLRTEGIDAKAFVADVRDRAALVRALDDARTEFGEIEVVQYSPIPAPEFMKPVLDTTPEDLTGPLEFSVLGPVAVVQDLLPGFRRLGRGTVLFVNGGTAVRPRGEYTGTSVAFAGESAYAHLLHDALAGENIHVAQLIIPRGIGAGEASHEPDALADRLWATHIARGEFRAYAAELD